MQRVDKLNGFIYPLRMAKKKKGVRYWHKKLWKVFSRYVRLRDSEEYLEMFPEVGEIGAACISCQNFYPIKNIQAGHFITSVKTRIKYDERNVHAQCYSCNIHKKGAWDDYYKAMQKKYGDNVIAELMELRNKPKRFTAEELEEAYDYYTAKVKEYTDKFGTIWK